MDLSVVNTYEPKAVGNNSRPIWEIIQEEYAKSHSGFFMDEVIEIMKERDRFGREKHGVPLQAFNGRNPLRDSIQEKCDFIAYIRQAIEEGYDVDDHLNDVYKQSLNQLEIILMVFFESEDI